MNIDQKQIEYLEQHCRTLEEEHEGDHKVWEMREQQLITEKEMLEQEQHLLQKTVIEQDVMLHTLQDELSRGKCVLEREHAEEMRRSESDYERRIEALRESENELKEENRHFILEVSQINEKHELQMRQIEDLKQENRELSEGERWSGGELRQALEELGKVKEQCMQLESGKQEAISRQEQALLNAEILEEKLLAMEEENNQLSQGKAALQRALQEVQSAKDELYAEMSAVKMELEMMNFKKKGNSLFAEVDDHRKKVELELLAIRGSYRSLEALYKNSQVITRRLKSEYTLLLCQRNSLKADGDYISVLKIDLDRTRNELELFRMECQTLENKLGNMHNLAKEFQQFQQMYGNKNPQDKQFTRFFNRQIKNWETFSKDLLHKLDTERKLVAELRQVGADHKTGLHQSERKAELCERECTLLKLKLEEAINEAKHPRSVGETPAKRERISAKSTTHHSPSLPFKEDDGRMEEMLSDGVDSNKENQNRIVSPNRTIADSILQPKKAHIHKTPLQ